MADFKDIIDLAEADGGKFFIMDSEGNPKLVIISIEDYQALLLGKLEKQETDVEEINREILKAQLEQENTQTVAPVNISTPTPRVYQRQPDLRAEVIDPSFDFEGPKVEIDDL